MSPSHSCVPWKYGKIHVFPLRGAGRTHGATPEQHPAPRLQLQGSHQPGNEARRMLHTLRNAARLVYSIT